MRSSWRSYEYTEIGADKLNRLIAFMASPGDPPFGTQTRFHLVHTVSPQLGRVRGTYGVIKGARDYIVGVVQQSERDMEDFGYLFEMIILIATDLGLGTCWMGGTFNRSGFADRVELKPDEILPAVSPVGYVARRRTVVDSLFRIGAGSKRRKKWGELFFDGDFSTPLEEAGDDYAVPIEMVRLAPSASNNQPWRIIRNGAGYHFFLQRSKNYDRLFRVDLQRIDMGIALCHFELAAAEEGLGGEWRIEDVDVGDLPERTEYVASWVR
jgi:hypothetical protein